MVRHKRLPFVALASLISGILLWLSWPERGITALIFIGWVPLLFAEHRFSSMHRRRKGWRMFGNFYIAIFTWNVLTCWWIYNSTDVGSIVAIGLNSFLMFVFWQLFYLV